MTVLQTARLILRPPCELDLGILTEIHEDPETARFLTGGRPSSGDPDLAWRNIAILIGHWHLRGFGTWVIEERLSGKVLGRVGFWYPPSWPAVELGWLIRKSETKKGYATEAAHRAVGWLRDETAISRIISLIHPDNVASIRVAEKIGERLEGQHSVNGTLHQVHSLQLKR